MTQKELDAIFTILSVGMLSFDTIIKSIDMSQELQDKVAVAFCTSHAVISDMIKKTVGSGLNLPPEAEDLIAKLNADKVGKTV